ncbi:MULTISPECIES: hypothetical protein [unclassified Streptomyces]
MLAAVHPTPPAGHQPPPVAGTARGPLALVGTLLPRTVTFLAFEGEAGHA